MKNQLHIGSDRLIEIAQAQPCLVIADEVPELPWAVYLDPAIHSFNLLKGLTYRKTCDIIGALDGIFSESGDGTLTKDTGLDFIAKQLAHAESFETLIPPIDKNSTTGHIWADLKIRRLLLSPVLRHMLCEPTNFPFRESSTILARVNRAELGPFDALAVTLFLMTQYSGQIIIPTFGRYAREYHEALLDEGRLIAGVNFLDELPPRLRRLALLYETVPSGTTYHDACALALAARKTPDTVDFNDFVYAAMMGRPASPQAYADPRSISDRTRNFVLKEKLRIARRAREARARRARRAAIEADLADPYSETVGGID